MSSRNTVLFYIFYLEDIHEENYGEWHFALGVTIWLLHEGKTNKDEKDRIFNRIIFVTIQLHKEIISIVYVAK